MKLRTIGMAAVAAVALVSGNARAQEAAPAAPAAAPAAGEGGWDTKYGILFTVPNPFGGDATAVVGTTGTAFAVGGANSGLLNDWDGGIGFQYNLAPQTALRFGVNLMRNSAGVTEHTNTAGLVWKEAPTWTSQYAIGLEGQYLMRLTTATVAPYFGAGVRVDFSQNNLNGDFNTTYGATLSKVDNYSRSWSGGLLATGGLEWRITKVLALFAEYRADLLLYSSTKSENKSTPAGGTTTKTKSDESHFLNLSTGLAHGGQIGLVAFF